MKEILKITAIIILLISLISCNQVFKNRYNLNKAYSLYEKEKIKTMTKLFLK